MFINKAFQLILLLFSTTLTNKNQISGLITYETVIIKPLETETKKVKSIKKDEQIYSEIIFNDYVYPLSSESVLTFNNFESNYKTKKVLDKDELSVSGRILFNSITKSKGVYYYNLKNNEEILEKNSFGNDFLIKSTRKNINWKISKENKYIGGYLCFKATTEVEVKNAVNKGAKKEVTAWFTNTIPLNIGPMDYSGLPGIILEAEIKSTYGKIITTAIKIELNSKNIKVEKPTKGKIVTQKEYDQISRKLFKKGYFQID